MIVTTAEKPAPELIDYAKRLGGELNAPYIPRRRDTLRGLERKHGGSGVLVVSADGLRFVSEQAPPLFFHPSMGLVRVKRLLRGETDAMVAVSGVDPGDTVLDCTAGLASDAIVFSHAVGPQGRVTAVEASRLLYTVIREGLRNAGTGVPEVDEACRRIEVRWGDHAGLLREMADDSFDIVYFDPMFDRPVQASASLLPLRSHAIHEPLSTETVRQAVRVARKSVVLKNASDSSEFSRLGFAPARVSASAVGYGVIRL